MGTVNLGLYGRDLITTMLVNGIAMGSCLVKRETIGSLRFREDIWHGEDTIFWFSVMQKTCKVAVADAAFVAIRQHGDKITLSSTAHNPDGSPVLPKETYIGIMMRLMPARQPWHEFTLRVVFRRIADNSWYSAGMAAFLLSKPFFGLRILTLLLRKRLYRYFLTLGSRIAGRKRHDFPWIDGI
jgi:hypothetical protein